MCSKYYEDIESHRQRKVKCQADQSLPPFIMGWGY